MGPEGVYTTGGTRFCTGQTWRQKWPLLYRLRTHSLEQLIPVLEVKQCLQDYSWEGFFYYSSYAPSRQGQLGTSL